MTKKRIQLIYSILVSISVVLAGICLIVACVKLYGFQPGSFSRESVAQAFRPIAIWVYICLILVVGGIVLNLISPAAPKKMVAQKQYEMILSNLRKKVDITKCEPAVCREIRKQHCFRTVHTIISYGLLVLFGSLALLICCVIINFYAAERTNEMNAAIIDSMQIFFPCLLVPFGYGIFAKYFRRHSLTTEIELLKKALANGAQADVVPAAPNRTKGTAIQVIRYVVLGIAVIILVGGFLFGGTADVLAKAAAICTECVGLG